MNPDTMIPWAKPDFYGDEEVIATPRRNKNQ